MNAILILVIIIFLGFFLYKLFFTQSVPEIVPVSISEQTNKYGFKELDITKPENLDHFYNNLKDYPESDRIMMMKSIVELVEDIVKKNPPSERWSYLQTNFEHMLKLFASLSTIDETEQS